MLSGCQSQSDSDDTPAVSGTIGGKFAPPGEKLMMIIGQDSDTIADYINDVPEDRIEGVTLYTQLKSADPNQTLSGVFSNGNWNSGNVNFKETLDAAPGATLAIGLAYDACNQVEHAEKIAAGEYD